MSNIKHQIGFFVVQTVDHKACNIRVMGSIPRETWTDINVDVYFECNASRFG